MPKLSDFTLLPLAIPPTAAFPKSITHTLYLRPHAPKIPTESDNRSLFVVNIPVDSTGAHFRAVFSSLIGAGRIEDVIFEGSQKGSNGKEEAPKGSPNVLRGNKRKRKNETESRDEEGALPQTWDRTLHHSGSNAVIVFVDSKALALALKTIRKLNSSSKPKSPTWPTSLPTVAALGSERYKMHQALRYPEKEELMRSVDAFMTGFNAKEQERERESKRRRNEPDEDGFVTVSKGGRTGPARREEVERKQLEMKEKEEKRRKEMDGFYRFQLREKRKAEQGELVKRFEEDKKRVQELKHKRGRFRPES